MLIPEECMKCEYVGLPTEEKIKHCEKCKLE